MKCSWPARLRTVLLAAVILSGGGGMPLLDLALYHGLTPDQASGPHFETGKPHSHGDTCRLSWSLSHCPQVESLHLAVQVVTSSIPAQPTAISAPASSHPGLPPARAPPSLPILPVPQLT